MLPSGASSLQQGTPGGELEVCALSSLQDLIANVVSDVLQSLPFPLDFGFWTWILDLGLGLGLDNKCLLDELVKT